MPPAPPGESRFSDAGRRRNALDDHRIAQLAARQHGIVALQQLVAQGYSERSVQRRAARGSLHRVHPGVYAVGHSKLTVHGHWLAAVLACRDDATLGCGHAAALHDLRGVPSGAIDVIARGRRAIPGVRAWPRILPAEDRMIVDGIPVTTVERTIVDLAPLLPAQRLRTLIEAAQRRGVIDFAVLRRHVADRQGRPGAPTLGAVLNELTDEPPWTQSEREQRFLELVRAAGLPEPHANAIVEGFVVDFSWPAQRVIVEIDGYAFHRGRRAFEDDRRRDAALQAAGWRVLRITARRLRDEPDAVLAELRRLLATWL